MKAHSGWCIGADDQEIHSYANAGTAEVPHCIPPLSNVTCWSTQLRVCTTYRRDHSSTAGSFPLLPRLGMHQVSGRTGTAVLKPSWFIFRTVEDTESKRCQYYVPLVRACKSLLCVVRELV